ncbi:hypothetical protein ANCCAN_29181, partial [Ancylostoma caninum]
MEATESTIEEKHEQSHKSKHSRSDSRTMEETDPASVNSDIETPRVNERLSATPASDENSEADAEKPSTYESKSSGSEKEKARGKK